MAQAKESTTRTNFRLLHLLIVSGTLVLAGFCALPVVTGWTPPAWLFALAGGLVLVLGTFVSWLISAAAKGLVGVRQVLSLDDQDKHDLARRFAETGFWEIRQVFASANAFLSSLENVLKETRSTFQGAQTNFSDMQATFTNALGILEAIREILEDFNYRSRLVKEEMAQVHSKTMELAMFNGSLVVEMAGQELEINMAAASMAGILEAIRDIAEMTRDRMTAVGELQAAAADGQSQMGESRRASHAILDSTKGILEASEVIKKLAAQTSILAMNAAIEAAHAGEAGKGFSVVAEEIRRLSDSTTASSKDITRNIKSAVKEIEAADKASEKAAGSFAKLMTGVQNFSQQVELIKGAISALAEQGKGVSSSIGIITKSMQTIKDSTLSINTKNQESMMTLGQMTDTSGQIVEGAQRINEKIDELYMEMLSGDEKGARAARDMAKVVGQLDRFGSGDKSS